MRTCPNPIHLRSHAYLACQSGRVLTLLCSNNWHLQKGRINRVQKDKLRSAYLSACSRDAYSVLQAIAHSETTITTSATGDSNCFHRVHEILAICRQIWNLNIRLKCRPADMSGRTKTNRTGNSIYLGPKLATIRRRLTIALTSNGRSRTREMKD